jgi:hypothetical protein
VTTPVSNTILVATNEFAATSLFTAADADSDSIVQYDFWNSGTGGGRWLLNGNPLGIGQDNLGDMAKQSNQLTVWAVDAAVRAGPGGFPFTSPVVIPVG